MRKIIDTIQRTSPIPAESPAYGEIVDDLGDLNLPVAFFAFSSPEKSHCGRTDDDGNVTTVPFLRLFLKFNEDVAAQGAVAKNGNWNDCWPLTDRVRKLLNDRLTRHNYPDHFCSRHTLVTLDSLERLALLQIGKDCKPVVKVLLERTIPTLKIENIYWNSGHHYTAVVAHSCKIKRIPKKEMPKVQRAIAEILESADVEGNCQRYDVTVGIKTSNANTFHDVREDV
jgi:hypothetical protein